MRLHRIPAQLSKRAVASPLRFGKSLEQAVRRWRKRWWSHRKFRVEQQDIDEAYAAFPTAQLLAKLPAQPRISVIVPVYRTDLRWLRACIESVRGQLYPGWELILVDDGSGVQSLTDELHRYSSLDDRIRILSLSRNQGISAATNYGIDHATGEFVGLLDHDDMLTPDALLWVAAAHNHNPRARWFYSDEAILQADGNYASRFHRKPAYSWEYLLSVMYTCHFTVYSRELIDRVGRLRGELNCAQDHDLALRISEQVTPDEVTHIPHVLYFWRAIPESTASSIDAKPAAIEAAHEAVSQAVQRRNIDCRVEPNEVIPTLFHLHLTPRSTPKVAVVIPTRNASSLVSRCVRSLIANTKYPEFEIVVIDNQSDEPELEVCLNELAQQTSLTKYRYDKPFNHSEMHNEVIPQLDADLVVLVNNDVYGFSSGWLEQLVATTQLDDKIAGAGGKLFYPDGTIQHAGVVIGVAGLAGNVSAGSPGDDPGHLGRNWSLQACSAVTGAFMIVRRDAFLEVGGFDAERYPVSYNDVDLWIRLGEAGYRCLFTPEAFAIHEESKTRGVTPQEESYRQRLRDDLERRAYVDPYWNLALFEDPNRRHRFESTSAWAKEKLDSLQRLANSMDRIAELSASH
ncbi:MAG: glycosyltransferase [Planctomycetia bacterium]|nr:glycosyltransferase [Planctomycetia bacterium]